MKGNLMVWGDVFLTKVDEVFDRISETPGLYAAEYKSVRKVGLRRFPYVVYYHVVGQIVEVIAVQHASRGSGDWQLRT